MRIWKLKTIFYGKILFKMQFPEKQLILELTSIEMNQFLTDQYQFYESEMNATRLMFRESRLTLMTLVSIVLRIHFGGCSKKHVFIQNCRHIPTK